MTKDQADLFASLALACIEREYPYQPSHAIRDADDLRRPRELHPAFYGCYDWHSAVHGHWLLARVLHLFPEAGQASAIRAALQRTLAAANIDAEVRYLREHPSFERPYGWAWLLKLASELAVSDDAALKKCFENLAPLAAAVEELYMEWLPKQTYPIRSGVHSNTAFGLAFALDYARSANRSNLQILLVEKAKEYYEADANYPAAWEPGGNDFFSPCLIEADLMQRVVPDFDAWLARFLPAIPESLSKPAMVSDRSDGQLVHLDGLNLSRAWCYFRLGLPRLAQPHLQAGLQSLGSGHYEGDHWLATFAAYALDAATSTPASRNAAT